MLPQSYFTYARRNVFSLRWGESILAEGKERIEDTQNTRVVLVCLAFHEILVGLDRQFFEFPFVTVLFSSFLVLMHLQNFMPSINTSHSFTEHFVTYKPPRKFHSTFCLWKMDRWFVRVVLTASSAFVTAFYLSACNYSGPSWADVFPHVCPRINCSIERSLKKLRNGFRTP